MVRLDLTRVIGLAAGRIEQPEGSSPFAIEVL